MDTTCTANALQALQIDATSPLMALPAELRLQTFEYIYNSAAETTTIDLREGQLVLSHRHSDADALESTSKQIRKECFGLRKYEIIAPIFGFSTQRRNVAGRLAKLAANTQQAGRLGKSSIYLGHLGSIGRLRWTEMYSCWTQVLEAITLLRERAPGLRLSLEVGIECGETVRYSFGVKDTWEVEEGMEHGCMVDGSEAVLSEAEAEKLRKISKTLVRTLFPNRLAV